MIRNGFSRVLQSFCMVAVVLFFSGACFAAPKEVKPTMTPDKPSAESRGATKPGASEPRGRVPKEEPVIRVGLSDGQASAVVTADGEYVIRDAATGQGIDKIAAKSITTVSVKNRKLVVNGKAISAQKIRFSIADSRTARYLSVAGSKYRGDIVLVLAEDQTITVVNEVKLDDYIGGVISEEMSPEWPLEALKAQAVAARTFAAYSLGIHDADGYDVCATTHCQVYGGIESESPAGLRAVSATRGEIMAYQGKPIYAAFHSSSGGMTAGSEEAGGNALPYLKPVRDPQDAANTNSHWQVTLSAKELSAKLSAAGFRIGNLKAVELTPLDIGKGASDRYPSGRIKQVRFIGSLQTVNVPGPKLRWVVGLPSTLADVRRGAGKKAAPNAKGKIEFSDPNAEVVFDGYGRGHGIGMSQWGAKALAAKKTYREILNHYYKDVEFSWLF